MKVAPTAIEGVMLVTPARHADERGWFSETWHQDRIAGLLGAGRFVQDNESFSRNRFTLRGLHYQRPPDAQAKLVRCLAGRMLDIAVDIRAGSPTYGQWVAAELSAQEGNQIYVPDYCLHGFLTLEPDTLVAYKTSRYYAPASEGTVHWASLGIDWPADADDIVLSAKDAAAPSFADFTTPFTDAAETGA